MYSGFYVITNLCIPCPWQFLVFSRIRSFIFPSLPVFIFCLGPNLGFVYVVSCFKCLYYIVFGGAQADNWSKKSCYEGVPHLISCVGYFWFPLAWSFPLYWQATLGFFGLPNDPSDVIVPLIDNLITLLCTILVTG